MPISAVWIVITIPKIDYEKDLNEKKKKNLNLLQIDSNKLESEIEKSTEKILEECIKELQISDASWITTKNGKYYQVYFTVDLYDNDATLQYLQSKGIGIRKESSVGYIPFSLFYCNEEEELDDSAKNFKEKHGFKAFKRMQSNFLRSVTSRLTVIEVVEGVRSSSDVTFDFLMYLTFAGFIAAAGLMNNSPIDITAAMMIEPVMATVLAVTFGLVILDLKLIKHGIFSMFIALLVCLLVGFIYGLIGFIWSYDWNPPPNGVWPTAEMQTRGQWRTLWYGVLQASAAGGAVAITLLNNNQAALVGVTVVSTFLPPFINAGLLWAYAAHIQIRGLGQPILPVNISGDIYYLRKAYIPSDGYVPEFYPDLRWECMALGGVSMIYTFVNIVFMLIVAFIMLKVKEIVPLGKMETNRRFFKEDIKEYRDYKSKSTVFGNQGEVGNQILQEWAELSGLDPKELLSQKPAAQITRLQTLKDIIQDIENDEVYQNIKRRAVGRPQLGNFFRRFTQSNVLAPDLNVQTNSILSSDDRNLLFNIEKQFKEYEDDQATVNTIEYNRDNTVRRSIRGLKPIEFEADRRRKSSVFLRQSLKNADHSPYSVWPSQLRKPSDGSEVRRRISQGPSVHPVSESTKF